MPCGIIYRGAGNGNPRGYRAGDITRVCPASECREDPAPGTPLKILILSDAEPEEMETVCQEQTGVNGNTLARSICQLDVVSLPPAVLAALQSRGRATCTKAEFMAAAFHKELGLQLSVAGMPAPRTIKKVDRSNEDGLRVRRG